MHRRDFLFALGALGISPRRTDDPGDFTLRIAPVSVEIAPKRIVKTTGYNGSFPGPVLRMTEGKQVSVDVFNNSTTPELTHWHGLWIPPAVDGAMEEGTPVIPPHGHSRYVFTPRPAGTRWYHSHVYAGRDLHRSTYSGQFGFLLVTPREDPARYDQEILLALHGWNPFFTTMGDLSGGDEGALEVAYTAFTVNSHALGGGEPIRVKEGQRVLFRILNANATQIHRVALAGHVFNVVALDGNAVPAPRAVPVLELAPGERVDAIVEMGAPGVWILGEADDKVRKNGLGVVVEYAGRSGEPAWSTPSRDAWDYTLFGKEAAPAGSDEQPIPLMFKEKWAGNRWVSHWTINGQEYPKTDPIRVRANGRYRLIFDNQSDDAHPVHLHRHSFELVNVAGKPSAGVFKDVVNLQPHSKVEARLIADNPGLSLFHCHMQLHMDFGFMTLLEYEK